VNPSPIALSNSVFETISIRMQDPQIQSAWLPTGGRAGRAYGSMWGHGVPCGSRMLFAFLVGKS